MREKRDNHFVTSNNNHRMSTKKSILNSSAISNKSSSSTSGSKVATVTKNNTNKSDSVLIVMGEDCQGWYDIGQQITGRNDTILSLSKSATAAAGGAGNNVTATTLINLSSWRQTADDLYAQEVCNFTSASKQQSTADDRWIEGTMSKGTMKDKIAAMSIVISNHPFHKLSTLDALLNLASSSMKGTTTSASTTTNQQARIRPMAIEALTDLFLHTLLPPHRNLIPLTQRPLHLYADATSTTNTTPTNRKKKTMNMGKKTLSPKVLLLWRYEELLKQRYLTFLRKVLNQEMLLLQSSSTSEQLMEGQKIIAIRTVITLLKERSECEAELLAMAVNKIGDPNRKVASSASYLLHSQLLTKHPAMTMVVAKEVQNLAFRPHLSSRALYNCIIFLNQLRFSADISTSNNTSIAPTTTLPQQLVQTYFKLFEIAISSTISTTTTITTTNQKKKKISGKSSKKQRKNHKAMGKTLSSSVSTSATTEKIQSRLLCALLTGVNRARPFLPKSDQKMDQYVDSIYRVAHQAPPSASTQALLLLFHLTVNDSPSTTITTTTTTTTQQQQQQDRLYRVIYSKLSDPAMYSGRHVTMFLNLIYKSMKYDTKDTRIVAFAKRLLQSTMSQSSAVGIVTGTLFLLSEVIKCKPILKYCIETNISNVTWDSTAREPTYALKKENKKKHNNTTNNINNEDDNDIYSNDPNDECNDTVGIDGCSIWELSMLLFHFHPSVVKFSETIGSISYDGDPTRNFTLSSFLDRFAYRQPKKVKESTAEDKQLFVQGSRRRQTNKIDLNAVVPLNDPSLIQKKPTKIAEEDKFFYRYFEERARRDEKKGIARNTNKVSKEEYQDEEDDDELEAIYAREKSNLDLDVS